MDEIVLFKIPYKSEGIFKTNWNLFELYPQSLYKNKMKSKRRFRNLIYKILLRNEAVLEEKITNGKYHCYPIITREEIQIYLKLVKE
jgi:hypothetical protein